MKRLMCVVLCVCFAGCGDPPRLCTLQAIADRHKVDVVDLSDAMYHADLGDDYAWCLVEGCQQSLLTPAQADELVELLDEPEVISERLRRRCDALEKRCDVLVKRCEMLVSRLAKLEAATPVAEEAAKSKCCGK